MGHSKSNADTFQKLLGEVLAALGCTERALAARLGVSQKTFSRWHLHGVLPPERTRVGLLHALQDVDPALLARIADVLGVPRDRLPATPKPSKTHGVETAHAFQSALLAAMEHLPNESAKRVREAVLLVVDAMAALGIEPEAAQAMLRGPTAKGTGKRSS